MATNVIIEASREGYSPEQVRNTMTVKELIEILSEYDEDAKVYSQDDEFIQIHEMYMSTDLDKDDFCKAWVHEKKLLAEIVKQTVRARELHQEKDRLADFLIAQAEKWSASDLREKAIEMLGDREYIRRKVTRGFNLWYDDRELINEILKK